MFRISSALTDLAAHEFHISHERASNLRHHAFLNRTRFAPLEIQGETFHSFLEVPPELGTLNIPPQFTRGHRCTRSAYRLTTSLKPNPTYIHSDLHLGDMTSILYLSPDGQPDHGTSFWFHTKHKTRFADHSAPLSQLADFAGDTKRREAWEAMGTSDGRFAHGCIFDSRLFHAAEPEGAFGESLDDGRLIFVSFWEKCGA